MFEIIDYYLFSATATKQLARLQFLVAQYEPTKMPELLAICQKIQAQGNQFLRRLKLDANTLNSFEIIFQEAHKIPPNSNVYAFILGDQNSLSSLINKDKIYRWSLRLKLASQGILNIELIRPVDEDNTIQKIILWDNILAWYQLASSNNEDSNLKKYKQRAITQLINKGENNDEDNQSFGIAQLHLFLKTLIENDLEIAIKIWNFMLENPELKIVIQDLLENATTHGDAVPAFQLRYLMTENPIFLQIIVEKIKLQNNDYETLDDNSKSNAHNWGLIHLQFIQPKNLVLFFKTYPQLLIKLLNSRIDEFIKKISKTEEPELSLIQESINLIEVYQSHEEIIKLVIEKKEISNFIRGIIRLLFRKPQAPTSLFSYFLDSSKFTQVLLEDFLIEIHGNQYLSSFLLERILKMPQWLNNDQRHILYSHLHIAIFYKEIQKNHCDFKPSHFIFRLIDKKTSVPDKQKILRELFVTRKNGPSYYLALTDSEWISLFRARDLDNHFNDAELENDEMDLDTMLTAYGEYHHFSIAWLDNIQRQSRLRISTHNFHLPSVSEAPKDKANHPSLSCLKRLPNTAEMTQSNPPFTEKYSSSDQQLGSNFFWAPVPNNFITLEKVISESSRQRLIQLIKHKNMSNIPTILDIENKIELALQDLIYRISLEFKKSSVPCPISKEDDNNEVNTIRNSGFVDNLVKAIVTNEMGRKYLLQLYSIDTSAVFDTDKEFCATIIQTLNSENIVLSDQNIENIRTAIHKIFLKWRQKPSNLSLIEPLLSIILANLSKIELKHIIQNTPKHQYGHSKYCKLLNNIIQHNIDENKSTNSHLLDLVLQKSTNYKLSREQLLEGMDLPILRELLSLPKYLTQPEMHKALIDCGLIEQDKLDFISTTSGTREATTSKKKNDSVVCIDKTELTAYDQLLDSTLRILENLKIHTANSIEFQTVLRMCELSIEYHKPYEALLKRKKTDYDGTSKIQFSINIPANNTDIPIVFHRPDNTTIQPELPSPQYPGRPSVYGMPSPSDLFPDKPNMPSPLISGPSILADAPSPFLGTPSTLGMPSPHLGTPSILGIPSPFLNETNRLDIPSPNPLYSGNPSIIATRLNPDYSYDDKSAAMPSPLPNAKPAPKFASVTSVLSSQYSVAGQLTAPGKPGGVDILSPWQLFQPKSGPAAMQSPQSNFKNQNLQTTRPTAAQETFKPPEEILAKMIFEPLSLPKCLALLQDYQIEPDEMNTELENLKGKIQEFITYQTSLLTRSPYTA